MKKIALVFGLILPVFASSALAQTYTWQPPEGFWAWNDPSNWSPAGVPDAPGESAVIPVSAGDASVDLDISPTIDSLSIESASAHLSLNVFDCRLTLVDPAGFINNSPNTMLFGIGTIEGAITNNSGAYLNLQAGALMALESDSITNNGTIVVDSDQSEWWTSLYIADSILEGTGQVVLNHEIFAHLSGYGEHPNIPVNAAGHTIRGQGQIEVSGFENQGTISADVPGAAIQLNEYLANFGTIEATNGAAVRIRTSIFQTPEGGGMPGEGGELLADGGNILFQGSAGAAGGTLRSTGASYFSCESATQSSDLTSLMELVLEGNFHIAAGGTTNLPWWGITNNGTMLVNSDQGAADAVLDLGSSYLEGTGDVVLNHQLKARLIGGSSELPTQGYDHTIRGQGRIEARFANYGTVQADVPGAAIYLVSNPKSNFGIFASTNGAVLRIEGITVTQQEEGAMGTGSLHAWGGEVILTDHAVIIGGYLDGSEPYIACASSGVSDYVTLQDTTNYGSYLIPAGAFTKLSGSGMINHGYITVNLDGLEPAAILDIGNTTIQGTGWVVLGHELTANLNGSPTELATNGPGHTIYGRGQINAGLLNLGSIIADGEIAINPTAIGFTNSGLMETRYPYSALTINTAESFSNQSLVAVLGGYLTANGDYTQTAGTTLVNGTLTTDGGELALQGGTLKGTGSISGTVNSAAGTVAPGASVGTLTIAGDLALSSGSLLDYEFGAPGGANDRIDVSGDLTLDGTLNVADAGGFGLGTYRLINYSGALTDNGLDLGSLPPGRHYSISAQSGQVNLEVLASPTPTARPTATPTPSAIPPTPTAAPPTPSAAPATPTPVTVPTPRRFVFDAANFWGTGGDDLGLWRASDGSWRIRDVSIVFYGLGTDVPVTGDYNGDGTADYGVWRPSTGRWWVRALYTNTTPLADFYFGMNGDVPVPADYDGDFRTDTAIWRPMNGYWAIKSQTRFYYGFIGDIPVPGDYNGDGRADPAVFRPAATSGVWYIRNISQKAWGLAGDSPAPGDYDGDGTTELALFRGYASTWYVLGSPSVTFGQSGDIPVAIDYEGDGTSDRVLYRPSEGNWYIYGVTTINYGISTDQPAVGRTY